MPGTVLVTGASRGIGRAIATRLSCSGHPVVLNFRSSHVEADKLRAEIATAGGTSRLLPFDVADREAAFGAIESDMAEHGPYWGVVCNAGVRADGAFPGMRSSDWDRVIETNLGGFFNVVRPALMPMIRAHAGGRIVSIVSTSGLRGNRGQVNYSASKAGLVGASKSLALELAKRRITVNCVAPGLVETDLTEGVAVEAMRKLIPMQRLGTAEDVAGAVAYLFSDDAAYVTGQTLAVDGGLT